MARSHHRAKKHHHPQQHQQHGAPSRPKRKAAPVFSIFGAVFGFAIVYFAADNIIAAVAGGIAGGVIGYFIGNGLDKSAAKN
jgi:hypothetical protein